MMFQPGRHITTEAGAALGQWARGEPVVTPDKALWDQARRAAHTGGSPALRAFSEGLVPGTRVKLRPISHELNRTAKMTDRNLTIDVTQPTPSQPEPPQTDRDGSPDPLSAGDIAWDPPTKLT